LGVGLGIGAKQDWVHALSFGEMGRKRG